MLQAEDLSFISKLSVFAGLENSALELVGRLGARATHPDRTVLYREGEPAKDMVIVLSGRLDVVKRNDRGAEACIASLGPGDVAGEMSLIDIQPRSAELRVVGETSVIVLSHKHLADIYNHDRDAYLLLVLNIAREISLRLRRVDEVLAKLIFEIGRNTSK
ncbi:MAG: cyclic nucleotide-binding domain-containing protein [Deltaproteobacteria bacterium]|nr:cyclic nucleotide-binding domain-containing protein [Deltaproteobacteria bacterium]